MDMNKKFPYIIAGTAFTVYILTIIFFAASLYLELKKHNVQERYKQITRETSQNLKANDIDSDAFVTTFLRSLGNLSDISFVQINHNDNVIFAYPSDKLYGENKKSSFVRYYNTELKTKDDIPLRLSIGIYRLRPYSIYRKGLIAFIIILITSLICLLYFIYFTIYGKEKAHVESDEDNSPDGDFEPMNNDEEPSFALMDEEDDSGDKEEATVDDSLIIEDEDENVDDETAIDKQTMEQLDSEEKENEEENAIAANTVSEEIAGIVAQLPVEDSAAVPAPAPKNEEVLEAQPIAEEPVPQIEKQAAEIEGPMAEAMQEEAEPLPEERNSSDAEPEAEPVQEEEIEPTDIEFTEEEASPVPPVPEQKSKPVLAPVMETEEEKQFEAIQIEHEHLQHKDIASANPDIPKGLYSDRTGFGWESYMIPRLDNELVRAASSEQDIALFTIRINDLNWISDEGTEIAKLIATTINFADLIFEYGDDGCMAIYPNINVETAISIAEDLHSNIIAILQDYSDLRPVRIGISARSLRMISGERLANESAQALEHTDEDSPIVAFKVNPQKYRNFLAEQAKMQQETM